MNRRITHAVIAYEVLGFLAVIALLWLDELFDLPWRLFGTEPTPFNWAESLIETGVVLVLGILVVLKTRYDIICIRYLEGFLPI